MYPKKIYEGMIKGDHSIVFQLGYNKYLIVWKDYTMVNGEINNEFYCHYESETNPAINEAITSLISHGGKK